jgi:uncharacterized protein
MESLTGFLFFIAIILIFIASQLFWFRRLGEGSARFVSNPRLRRALGWVGVVLYLFFFAYNMPWLGRGKEPTHLTLKAALFEAPFRWWFFSSVLGFAIIIIFRVVDHIAGAARWAYQTSRSRYRAEPSADPPSSSRRQFLEQTALTLSAAPFLAGAYGLFYGRLNLETTQKRIALHRLPKAFQGFRVAQLSDFHIGPFMTAEEIRKYVEIANRLKPDLFALTGDFLTWDPTTQEPIVEALAALKAPFGVFGCLGNHELWTDTENSITRLFAAKGVRILRQARLPIESQGETLNLIGVDFQGRHGPPRVAVRYLRGIEPLVRPHMVNILLSHNPNTFDQAAALGIDLSLAGHTHGGQVTLEFIHPSLTPSRLITSYVKGWFKKGAAQLYVNRGIGTIGVPIRVGAPPEITVFELVREA